MADPVPVCTGTAGLNNRLPYHRIGRDPETGIIDLAACVNLRLDRSGMPSMRPGQELLHGGNFHSVFTRGPLGYAGLDDSIYQVNHDLSLSGVRSGLSGERISFVWTPLGVYYANGSDKGVLRDNASFAWLRQTPSRREDTRYYTGPPERARHLELFAGRILAAEDNVLWRSQPNAYGLFRVGTEYNRLPYRLRMVRAVAGGVYVSDERKTYFFQGTEPGKWDRKTVMESPAMEFSDMTDLIEPAELFFDPAKSGVNGDDPFAVWVSSEGLVYGGPDGTIHVPTRARIKFPGGFNRGACVLMGQNFIYNLHT
jgi:hypothetical protein